MTELSASLGAPVSTVHREVRRLERAGLLTSGSIPRASSVIIFGSWAARYAGQSAGAPGDVDVLVVGDVDRATVYDAADRAQRRLGQQVNATLVGQERWAEGTEPFLATVRSGPYLVVLGEVA